MFGVTVRMEATMCGKWEEGGGGGWYMFTNMDEPKKTCVVTCESVSSEDRCPTKDVQCKEVHLSSFAKTGSGDQGMDLRAL
ncbi:hypothetical protein C0Q70_21047 [Pomacea canaliculata]|uniref:Uncharacterized protein n=1 Tax=Pomacea canaliculata TaxID=400727 RepID=A0A2T7NBF5_POMCA|nr:hypothetical protein C0Q70_21047 [Pomacea canaliculata]